MTDPKDTTASGAVELDETALETAAGGVEAWPSKWKGFSLDGKGTDVLQQEWSLTYEGIQRVK